MANSTEVIYVAEMKAIRRKFLFESTPCHAYGMQLYTTTTTVQTDAYPNMSCRKSNRSSGGSSVS